MSCGNILYLCAYMLPSIDVHLEVPSHLSLRLYAFLAMSPWNNQDGFCNPPYTTSACYLYLFPTDRIIHLILATILSF